MVSRQTVDEKSLYMHALRAHQCYRKEDCILMLSILDETIRAVVLKALTQYGFMIKTGRAPPGALEQQLSIILEALAPMAAQ